MLTEFKGTFRDRFEGEKEYHITENAKENGFFEYTVFCPFSNRSSVVQSRVRLEQVSCNGCLRAYQIYRAEAVESAAHGAESAGHGGAHSTEHGVPAERAHPHHVAVTASSDQFQSLTG